MVFLLATTFSELKVGFTTELSRANRVKKLQINNHLRVRYSNNTVYQMSNVRMWLVPSVINGARHGRVTKYFRQRRKYTTSNHGHRVLLKIELVAIFASSWCTLVVNPFSSQQPWK